MKKGEMKKGELYFSKEGARWNLVRYVSKMNSDLGMFREMSNLEGKILFFKGNIFPLNSILPQDARRKIVKIIFGRIFGGDK